MIHSTELLLLVDEGIYEIGFNGEQVFVLIMN